MRSTAGLLLVLALTGLPISGLRAAQPRAAPAIITHPTAASRAALERAVAKEFHGAYVRLAPDALTRESQLLIGRAQARDGRGIPLNGRELTGPQHFRLLRRGAQCVLLHEETGKARVLVHVTCRVLSAGAARR